MTGEAGQASTPQGFTETDPATFSNYPANRAAQHTPKGGSANRKPDPDLTTLADAIAGIPEADRPAVVAHVLALTRMSGTLRAAILTLTRET